MIIKNGIIFVWTGTNASIPTGWSRVTGLDGVFPKGTAASTEPNVSGGATTHSHTSPTHTHSAGAHTHTITIPNAINGYACDGGTSSIILAHTHPNLTSGAVAGFSCDSPAATYSSVSNNPPYYEVIYITPTTNTYYLPVGVIGLTDATAPAGFNVCNGANSTPNLVDKYLKGATTGGDAGGTGGSTTNVHNLTHTHSTSHSHAATTSGGDSGGQLNNKSGSGTISSHTHSVAPGNQTISSSDTPSLTTSETVEPAFTYLMAIQNASVSSIVPNIIALWTGTLATIPVGWILCDGSNGTVDMRNRHLKITATVGTIGTTGGSNTHTHAAQGHTHTIAHSGHTASVSHGSSNGTVAGSASVATASSSTHECTVNSQNLVLSSSNTTANSSNNEPQYLTVAFIKLNQRIETASFLFNFL